LQNQLINSLLRQVVAIVLKLGVPDLTWKLNFTLNLHGFKQKGPKKHPRSYWSFTGSLLYVSRRSIWPWIIIIREGASSSFATVIIDHSWLMLVFHLELVSFYAHC